MADIEYIVNVASCGHFFAAIATWTTNIPSLPNGNPDECVIRSITFNNDKVDDAKIYMIWCNLKNDFIGSISGGAITTIAPGTRLRLNSPVPNQLQFRLYVPDTDGPIHDDTPITADIVIHMDLIKYKHVPPHA